MRIANKERFLISCLFFTMSVTLFVRYNSKCNDVLAEKKSISQAISIKTNTTKNHKTNLLSNNKKVNEKNKVIVLDPGHGGIDKGTSVGDLYEKELNLKIALYAKEFLERKGYTVFMTRDTDILLSLREIGDFVNEKFPSAFVSIHINSFKKSEYKGITTYYYDVNGFQQEERIKFATIIQNNACGNNVWKDRGIRRQNLAVLRYSKVPCALVECGFITNSEDRERLRNDKVLKITAENIGKGIIEYLIYKEDLLKDKN